MYCRTFDNTRVELKSLNDIYKIKNNNNVIELTLCNNNISELNKVVIQYIINVLKYLTNLQILRLDNNKFTRLDNNIFKHLTNLRVLCLNNNKINNVNARSFKHLTYLHTLYLGFNNLTQLNKNIFKHLINLKQLSVNNNNLNQLNKNIFKHLTNLQVLHLHNNSLTYLDKDIFKNLTNLCQLYLHNNNLTNLDNNIFRHLKKLQVLYLHYNKLYNLPYSIVYCENLIYIHYHNNNIKRITPNIGQFLYELKNKSNKPIINNTYHTIKDCIKLSLDNILNYHKSYNKYELINDLINSKMNDKFLKLLIEYCNDNSVHSVLNITFEKALLHILDYINLELKDNQDDILNILETEILDSRCKCITCNISHLVFCLNGFSPLVNLNISNKINVSNLVIINI